MRKVLVATHGRFAEGIRETMQFIMGDEGTVDVLNAYTSQEFDILGKYCSRIYGA